MISIQAISKLATKVSVTIVNRNKIQFPQRFLSILDPNWGTVLDGSLVKNSDYENNKKLMDSYTDDLKAAHQKCLLGGGEVAVKRHKSRGKLTARERIDGLVDIGTPVLELSTLAGWEMYGDGVASGGIITAIGRVNK